MEWGTAARQGLGKEAGVVLIVRVYDRFSAMQRYVVSRWMRVSCRVLRDSATVACISYHERD
jgi:hypothetical protein